MSKMKLIMMALLIAFLGSCEKEELDLTDYSGFPDHLVQSYYEAEHMNNNKYIVYYYSAACSHCQDVKAEVLEFFADFTALDFYFVDTSDMKDKSTIPEFYGTPTLYVLSEGKVSEEYTGYIKVREFINKYTDFTVDYTSFPYQIFSSYEELSHIVDTEYVIYVYSKSSTESNAIKETVLNWAFTKSTSDIAFIDLDTMKGEAPEGFPILTDGTPQMLLMYKNIFTNISYDGTEEVLQYIESIGDGDITAPDMSAE